MPKAGQKSDFSFLSLQFKSGQFTTTVRIHLPFLLPLVFNNNSSSSVSSSFQQHYNWSRQHEEAKAKRLQFERLNSTGKGTERELMPEILGESCDSVRKSFGARQTTGCFLVWWLYCSIAIRTINDRLPEFSHRSQFYGDWPLRLWCIQDGYQLIPITGRTGLLRFRCCIKATKPKQSVQLPAENPSHHLRASPNIVGSGIHVVLSTFPLQNWRRIYKKKKKKKDRHETIYRVGHVNHSSKTNNAKSK